ncbi:MAG: M13-type metalloendopeptidase [Dermatophilaceae bacterium]
MHSGIRVHHIDSTTRPQDDLYRHVNGRWIDATEIPGDKGRYGSFDMLRETAESDLRDIIETTAEADPDRATPAGKVVNLYRSFMDEATIESRGLTGLRDLLDDIAAVASTADLPAILGKLEREGASGAFQLYVNTDDRQSDRYVVYLNQGGLGLPDESYYREERHADVRAAYVTHIAQMLGLGGAADPTGAARRVMALETRLAAHHLDNVSDRDAVATYTLLTRAELETLTPHIAWDAYAASLQAPSTAFDEVVVRQPDYLAAFDAALMEVDIADWRDWLTWHTLHEFAPYLPDAFVQENFEFYGRTLAGTPQLRDRWKRGITLVDGCLPEALGELYVAEHFPPDAKAHMERLVGHLVEAFRRAFTASEWMGPATQAEALTKLESFTPKIGYPDTWRDYSALSIDDDLVGNVRRAAAFESDRNLAKLGQPIDRAEWFMGPQTVNAYYNPGMNEIVFPAAILQPPFFDAHADDAVNYGGIGAVIGHEIGHGFDDQGSQFDGVGNLRDWWTEDDRARFDALAQKLITQFNAIESASAPGHFINGALTVGENIGDLAGIGIGHAAYRLSLGGQEPPILDGYTGDQRFFLGWAQVWMGKAREETAQMLLAVDPHSPQEARGNAVRNLDAFHAAFDVTPADRMWLAPEDRVSIF